MSVFFFFSGTKTNDIGFVESKACNICIKPSFCTSEHLPLHPTSINIRYMVHSLISFQKPVHPKIQFEKQQFLWFSACRGLFLLQWQDFATCHLDNRKKTRGKFPSITSFKYIIRNLDPWKVIWQWNIHHEWRCVSYWEWGFSNVMLVFRGVIPLMEEIRLATCYKWNPMKRGIFSIATGGAGSLPSTVSST